MSWLRLVRLWRFDGGNNCLGDSTNAVNMNEVR
jgi:hypothetical protein